MLLQAAVCAPGLKEIQTSTFDEVDKRCKTATAINTRTADTQDLTFFSAGIDLDEIAGWTSEVGLLAIDVQGAELDILQNYSWQKYPNFIVVEPHSLSARETILSLLECRNYELIGFKLPWNRSENLIFRRQT